MGCYGSPNYNYLLGPFVTTIDIFYTNLKQLLIQVCLINMLLQKSKIIKA